MIQTFGSLALIFAVLLPILVSVGIFFKLAMEAHGDFYRYEQSHHFEQRIDIELQDSDWTNER